MIELKNIYKQYVTGDTKQTVLKDINLKINDGEVIAIMGPSGSGKSTLMNLLGLLDKPTSGDMFLDNLKISNLTKDQLADLRNQKIGFVFQQFYLLPRLTVLQNVALPLTYRNTPKELRNEKAVTLLNKVQLEDKHNVFPNTLSGGQQQRVAIARALVGKPSVILADEPTGALDSQTGNEILELFLSLNKEQNITVIIVTHDENVAKRCNRVIRIQDGEILKQ